MKRYYFGLIVFFVVLVVFTSTCKADRFYTKIGEEEQVAAQTTRLDYKDGVEGQTAFKSEDADIIKDENSIRLSGGPNPSGLASVFYLFKADRNAVGFNIIVDYHGDAQIEIIDTLLSTKEDPRSYVFPINGKDDNQGKRTIRFADPMSRVLDKDNNIEIHASVGPGKCLKLNSIAVEYIYQQEEKEKIQKEIKVVNRYYGILPPGYSYSVLNYYQRGPIWVWQSSGWYVYDGWWYSPSYTEWVRVYYPAPIYCYYYHYCGEPYVAEKYIYYRNGGRRGHDRRDFALEQGPLARIRSVVDPKIVEKRAPFGTSQKNESNSPKTVINEKQAKIAQGKKGPTREAMMMLVQRQNQQVKSAPEVDGISGNVAGQKISRQQAKNLDSTQKSNGSKESSTSVKFESRSVVPTVQASPGKAGFLQEKFNRVVQKTRQMGEGMVRVQPSGSGYSSAPARESNNQQRVIAQGETVVSAKHRSTGSEQQTQTQTQTQPAPARSEQRVQNNSSTNNSSSSSDDDEHKKRRRGK